MLLARFKPTQARMAQVRRMPMGDSPSFFSIKSAQKRRLNIISEVKTKRILPSAEVRILPIMFCAQESVPNSTAPTSAWVMNITKMSQTPKGTRTSPRFPCVWVIIRITTRITPVAPTTPIELKKSPSMTATTVPPKRPIS